MKHQDELNWFEQQNQTSQFKRFTERPIAYFCAEYALSQKIPTYSGGLGVLAGDVVREAADRKLPFVAIGLYYHEGYVCDPHEPMKTCEVTPPAQVGFSPVMDKNKKCLKITIPIEDHDVVAQAWEIKIGDNSVYMLDTNLEENTASDRAITNRLYVDDKETRLKQEMILGIGGQRLLEALDIHPSVYHLNEGHSAFLTLELIHHQMKERDLSFDEAKQYARRRVVFTNHTLVPAGNEVYSNDLVSLMLTRYAQEINVPTDKLVKLGLIQESSKFSMTMLPLRTAGIINAVSKLHSKKAREIWRDHPMVGITNGVHVDTWDMIKKNLPKPGSLWQLHQKRKKELLKFIKKQTKVAWLEDELLIGWARRFVTYKRPLAIVEDIANFKKIAQNNSKPVKLVMAGIPHPSDEKGLAILNKLISLTQNELKGSVVYLENYSMDMAKLLQSGCDVWANTPIVGFEACGTSGMKAAMNGVLPFSTKDGWVDEVELFKVGWLIDNEHITKNIHNILENDIVPMYYNKDKNGVPKLWEEHMRNAREMAMNKFCATRMLREYLEMLYL